MQTMPPARPSSPSMKFTALTMTTTRTTEMTMPWVGLTATGPTPGTGRVITVTPCQTITPAAIIWPPSFTRASTPHLSSSTPSSHMMPAPESSARMSVPWENTLLRLSSWEATRMPAQSPPNIAMPPSRGVGSRCTSRARTGGIAPAAMANFRTGPVSR